jgi:hypothetical protein
MQNLEIQFSGSVIEKVKKLNLRVDRLGSVLFILFALHEKRYDLLDEFDDSNRQKFALLLYKDLEMKGLLEQNTQADTPHFILSSRGTEFVESIKKEFTVQPTAKDIAIFGADALIREVPSDGVDWIEEWLDLFPRGVRSGGKLLRADSQSCLKKMEVFTKTYPAYTKDVIMEATRRYLEDRAAVNYEYTRCAVYFIYRLEKQGGETISDLASWCDQVKHEKSNPAPLDNSMDIMV